MAESISEGTLKTWQKKVGDTVAADEEIATIETDKVCTVLPVPSLVPFLPPFIVASISGSYYSVHFVTSELDSQ
jgi:hypothetical protein